MDEIKDVMYPNDILKKIQETEPAYEPKNVINIRQTDKTDYKILFFDEIEASNPLPIEFIVDPFLPTQGIAWIYAGSGMGKTLFTLNLAYAIASGGNFLKYSCPKPRKLLYLDGEMKYTQVYNRLMKIKEKQGEIDYVKNFALFTGDENKLHGIPHIDTIEGQKIYDDLIEEHNFEIVVIDNLSMLSSFEESKASEWKPIQNWILKHKRNGRSFIIVHHAGKPNNHGTTYRGTSKMIDCADTVIALQPIKDDRTEDEQINLKKFKISYEKARDFGGKDAMSFEVSFENGIWSYQSLERTTIEEIVKRMNMGINQVSIAKELNVSPPYVNKLVMAARRQGLLNK